LRLNNGTSEDEALDRYLATATELFELHSSGRTVHQTVFTQHSPCWSSCYRPLRLNRAKVSAVASVKYYDTEDTLQTLSSADYGLDLTGTPALVWLKDGAAWPALSAYRPRPVQVQFTAGFATVPEDVKQGILLLAAHFYANRGDSDTDIPQGFVRLANKWHTGLDYVPAN
jgi:uncharacterized phiE125 gp8 family phage protein